MKLLPFLLFLSLGLQAQHIQWDLSSNLKWSDKDSVLKIGDTYLLRGRFDYFKWPENFIHDTTYFVSTDSPVLLSNNILISNAKQGFCIVVTEKDSILDYPPYTFYVDYSDDVIKSQPYLKGYLQGINKYFDAIPQSEWSLAILDLQEFLKPVLPAFELRNFKAKNKL